MTLDSVLCYGILWRQRHSATTVLHLGGGGDCLDIVAESGKVIFGVGDGECGVDSSGVSDKGSVDMWRERRSDGNREAAGKEKWQAVR